MPGENMLTHDQVHLSNVNYAFFTTEAGTSDAGYRINGERTRNVNIFSPEQSKEPGKGFDSSACVLDNVMRCFVELGATESTHKFFMTSFYAGNGKSDPRIYTCQNVSDLDALKTLGIEGARTILKPESGMGEQLLQQGIGVLKADALIFKAIPGQDFAMLGASGDAHPIMMFDDENKLACYVSGAHAALKQGVLERAFDEMLRLGAKVENIKVVIGPGLGPNSYEFGDNAPDYFQVPDAIEFVKDLEGKPKCLINIDRLVKGKLQTRIAPEHIFNLNLNTTGFDLYVPSAPDSDGKTVKTRRETFDFKELSEQGLLLFSARREIMSRAEDLSARNSGAHSTVGRHGAGFLLRN